MRTLSREEQVLFDEMKERCLAKGQYKDEKAKDKFKMLCHLEDFMIQYWELLKENQELKKQLENYKKLGFKYLQDKNNNLETQQKKFIKYLEDEKDRLIKETSHYYIDSFDRQHAVNEDIFDEVNDILQKYKSIIGENDV